MKFEYMRELLGLQRYGSFTLTSEKMFIAQPSLTSSIHEIEKEYGITIFVRGNKGVELTPEGDEFLGYARQIRHILMWRSRAIHGSQKMYIRLCWSNVST